MQSSFPNTGGTHCHNNGGYTLKSKDHKGRTCTRILLASISCIGFQSHVYRYVTLIPKSVFLINGTHVYEVVEHKPTSDWLPYWYNWPNTDFYIRFFFLNNIWRTSFIHNCISQINIIVFNSWTAGGRWVDLLQLWPQMIPPLPLCAPVSRVWSSPQLSDSHLANNSGSVTFLSCVKSDTTRWKHTGSYRMSHLNKSHFKFTITETWLQFIMAHPTKRCEGMWIRLVTFKEFFMLISDWGHI